jgi:germination protein M
MNRKHIGKLHILLLVLCLMTCSLTGCREGSGSEEGTPIYYISSEGTKLETHSFEVEGTGAENRVRQMLDYLAQTPENLSYQAPLSMGFQLLSYTLDNGKLSLDMSIEYYDLSPATEVLVRAALVRTLCQVSSVNHVRITVAGESLMDNAGETVGWMDESLFISNDGNAINTYESARIRLYFATEDGTQLVSAYREKYYLTSMSKERFIVEEMIAGPSGQISGIYATISPETDIISVNTRDGVCYVNLDSDFLTVYNNVSTEIAIYSLVNSLTDLSYVSKVQILINGEVPGTFASTYEQNTDIVTTLSSIYTEQSQQDAQ